MAIISVDYFSDSIKNVPASDEETLQAAIDIYEPDYLRRVLGYPLAKAFSDGLLQVTVEARWMELLEGVEFNYHGSIMKWDGFEDETNFKSPIANYIMAKYTTDNASNNTGIGEAISKGVHSDQANPMPRVVANWNAMYDQNLILAAFISSSGLYPEYDGRVDYQLFRPLNLLGI